MRSKAIACAITITAVGILAPNANTSATKKKTITCTFNLSTQSFPTATAPGEDFGKVRCSSPFGNGLQYDTFTLMPAAADPTTGKAELRFKAYFNTGTVSGVWRADYKFTSQTMGTFVQKVSWTKGTGRFRNVRGTGTGTGTQDGNKGTVKQTIKVTGL